MRIYCFGIGFTMIAAVLDLFRVSGINAVSGIVASAEGWLPLYSMGLGWVTPSVLGVIIGLCVYIAHQEKGRSLKIYINRLRIIGGFLCIKPLETAIKPYKIYVNMLYATSGCAIVQYIL